ncbi:MAG: hypothetical protein ACRDHP_10930, partial [Ktedonobacterales bacterium]
TGQRNATQRAMRGGQSSGWRFCRHMDLTSDAAGRPPDAPTTPPDRSQRERRGEAMDEKNCE